MPQPCPVPKGALLQPYVDRAEAYTDCFSEVLPGNITLAAFVSAFYTTWLFRLERAVLTLSQRRRIRDAEVAALARGEAERFAVWRVEARSDNQILLCDISGHTRSFLAVAAEEGGATRLLFGSAVVGDAAGEFPFWVNVLMPFHRVYSKALLYLAATRLRRG